jgi:hypothetical protein
VTDAEILILAKYVSGGADVGEDVLRSPVYRRVATCPGWMYWKNGILESYIYYIYVRDTSVAVEARTKQLPGQRDACPDSLAAGAWEIKWNGECQMRYIAL